MHKLDLQQDETTTNQVKTPIDAPTVSADNHTVPQYNVTAESNPTRTSMQKKSKQTIMITSILAVVAGVATGFGGYKLMAKSQAPLAPATQPVAGQNIEKGAIFGSQDQDAFKDSAQGYLVKGGLDGEGSHHILRPGGTTQTVYLTSSVTDLDALEGMEVKVWGETFKAQKAGWLMDVGRVEVIEPKGEKPIEE